MPKHIRDNLPVELSELPAESMYAAIVLGFSRSEPVRQAEEAHDSLVHFFNDLYGGAWPPEAVDAARETWQEFECAHQRMEEAMWWVRANRCPTPVTTDSSSDEEAGEEAGEQADEEAGEEAGEEADEEAGRRSGRGSSSDEEARASSQGQAGEEVFSPLPPLPGDVQTLRTALQMWNPICGLSMMMAGWRWTNRASKLAETTRRTTRCCERTPGALASSQGQPG